MFFVVLEKNQRHFNLGPLASATHCGICGAVLN